MTKAVEIGKLVKEEKAILGITETQDKFGKIEWPKGLSAWEQYREMNDKKGGGMAMVGMTDLYGDKVEVGDSRNRDVMNLVIELGRGKYIRIILVYVDVKDKGIYEEVNRMMRGLEDEERVVIMGDFNAHVGFLGRQELNYNGKLLMEFVEKWNLIMLNADDRCEGEVTRRQRGEESVLDFILVSSNVYEKYRGMYIDENKTKFDLSDHCLLMVELELEDLGRVYTHR